MAKVKFSQRVLKKTEKMGLPLHILKRATMFIERTDKQKLYNDYPMTLDTGNIKLYVIVEFEENDIAYIKEMKQTHKKYTKWTPRK